MDSTALTHPTDGSLAPETIERESSVSPVSLPPSPLADREGATSSRTVEKTTTVRTVPVEHTKVVYRRHTSLTRRQESVNEFAMVFLPMILLSLFAEASGMARPLLHLAWATWAVAQMAYHAYGRDIRDHKDGV